MSPKVSLPKGGELGKDMDEQAGTEAGRSTVTGERRGVEAGGCSGVDGGRLPASEAAVEAVPEGGRGRATTPQRGAGIESGEAEEIPGAGVAASAEAIRRGGGGGGLGGAGGGGSGKRGGAA